MMYDYRIRWKQLGGHIHCRLFSKRDNGGTWALCGNLVFNEEEWPFAKNALNNCELLPEE